MTHIAPENIEETTNDLIEWVRNTDKEIDAIWNARKILAEYEDRKTFLEKFYSLFV